MLPNYSKETKGILYFVLSSCIKAQYNGNCCCNRRLETCWEQHIPLLCERNQGTEHYVLTSLSYTTLPRSLCELWGPIHLAQKLWKHWRCSGPMQRLPPWLLSDLKVSILSTLGAATSKVNNSGENYCTASMNSSSVPCLTSVSLVTGTTVARRLQISWNWK